ncbi:MAG: methyl-accepting chemotaxis protein [Deferribacteraceae bacterium]|jgi:methyl-accepting chemotaxis protein|nr:methyl-accepting chemotaxis protein [Deferribacteraceae bacterium]
MTVKAKVYAAMLFLSVLCVAAAILIYNTVTRLDEGNTTLFANVTDALGMEQLASAQYDLYIQVVLGIWGRAESTPEREVVQRMNAAISAYESVRDDVLYQVDFPENIDFIQKSYDRVLQVVKQNVTQQVLTPRTEPVTRELRMQWSNEAESFFENEFASVTAQIEKTADKFQVVYSDTNEIFASGKAYTITVFLILIACFMGILVMAKFMVIDKLNMLVDAFEEVTGGDGDLTKLIKVTTHDELGAMSEHFNKFTDQVADIVRKVKVATDEANNANTAMAATMEELSATFQNQNVQVATVASAMEEMSSSALEISATLDSNRNLTNDATEQSREGVKQLAAAMDSINMIHRKTDQLASTINNLSESSIKIGEILNVINDIADQTNLLALNAAIEAARAGDAGRGFAVVADEVRKLAERTQNATSEIETIITSLQRESSTASTEMKEAGASVEDGVKSLNLTKGTIDVMVRNVEDIQRNAEQMAVAVDQQSAAIAGVNDNTQAMASGIEECSTVVDEVAHSTTDLMEKSGATIKILNFFKV